MHIKLLTLKNIIFFLNYVSPSINDMCILLTNSIKYYKEVNNIETKDDFWILQYISCSYIFKTLEVYQNFLKFELKNQQKNNPEVDIYSFNLLIDLIEDLKNPIYIPIINLEYFVKNFIFLLEEFEFKYKALSNSSTGNKTNFFLFELKMRKFDLNCCISNISTQNVLNLFGGSKVLDEILIKEFEQLEIRFDKLKMFKEENKDLWESINGKKNFKNVFIFNISVLGVIFCVYFFIFNLIRTRFG